MKFLNKPLAIYTSQKIQKIDLFFFKNLNKVA